MYLNAAPTVPRYHLLAISGPHRFYWSGFQWGRFPPWRGFLLAEAQAELRKSAVKQRRPLVVRA